MSRSIRVVAPFKPFDPESELHRSLPDFDWLDAVRMLVQSVQASCRCPVHAVTDLTSALPVPALRYPTVETRLMLWTLEACCCYLESDDFDRDTVMLDVDQLVFHDLADAFPAEGDLGVLIRPLGKHSTVEPLLNGVQFWSVAAKARLGPFYRRVLATARRLPEAQLQWGADTVALRRHLEPMQIGPSVRDGLAVEAVLASRVLEAFSSDQMAALKAGQLAPPTRAVVDFRWKRKPFMRPVFEALCGVPSCRS